jgi:glycosyltransferase involved in cell wall biosynthesis
MLPKVTIVTITYNSSKFVRQAIESVLAQSFTNFEYIISDDCSSDNTWDIIQEYKDPRIRAWRNQTNLGEYPNRNLTLEKAKGEYIIWIDGDDIFYPHGLEFMVKMLDAFPTSAMACTRPYWPNMVYPVELSPQESLKYEFLGSPILVNGFPDTLFKRKYLLNINGFPEDIISGDTYSKRLIACTDNILLINQQVSWWRRTPGQASSKLNSLNGVINTFNSSLSIIENPMCPLTFENKVQAKELLKIGLAKYLILKALKRFKILKTFHIKKISKLNIRHFFMAFKKRKYFYSTGSSSNPLTSSLRQNPYSFFNEHS